MGAMVSLPSEVLLQEALRSEGEEGSERVDAVLLAREEHRRRALERGGLGELIWIFTPPSWLREGRFWWTDVVVIFVFQFLASLVVFVVWSAFFPKPKGVRGLSADILLASLGGQVVVVALYLWIGRRLRLLTWPEMGWQSPKGRAWWVWLLSFFPLMVGFSALYMLLLKFAGIPMPKQDIARFFSAQVPMATQVLAVLMVVLGAPIAEEVLYRGMLFHSLEPRLGLHGAAALSAVVFGAIHMQLGTLLPLAFLGYLLALSFASSRSLWVPIGLHAANNLIALVSVYLGKT